MHPLIREFYEHTSRFRLSIVPDWRSWMIRGWIRTFADSGKPIYVGIYTTFRHDGRGYVSVGVPIPGANFTATLEPRNTGEHDLLLTSRSELAFPGHYLSSVDSERDAVTVLKLLSFEEEIYVYVADGELKTEHSFHLAGQRFLTLHYEIERLAGGSA